MTNAEYALGHSDPELERLDRQGAMLAEATGHLLRLAGIGPGMHVLDMGTGTGQVAGLTAELVGPSGSVTGVDQSTDALARARRRAGTNITYLDGDVTTFRPEIPVDAVTCRLVLAYQRDPAEVLRHWATCARPNGIVMAMEYDVSGARAVPPVPLLTDVVRWITSAFDAVGQGQGLGAHLAELFALADLRDVSTFGCQIYLRKDDPAGPELFHGVLQSLLPVIERAEIASRAEVELDSLRQRLTDQIAEHDATICPPTLVGVWGRVARDA